MKSLSFGEQAIVGKLIANSADPVASFPIKALESIFQDSKVTFHNDEVPYFNFYVGEGKQETVKETSKRVLDKILEAVNLVDYLVKNGMLVELDAGKDPNITFGDDNGYSASGLVEVRVYIEVESIAKQLVRLANNSFYVTQSLKDLAANGFKTFEDNALAEAKLLTKKARFAVVLAFVAVLVSVAGLVVAMRGAGDSANDEKSAALKESVESIQGSLENKILPAIVDLKAEVSGVKTAVTELDSEPVNLNDLQNGEEESPKKAPSKKKSKRKRR